MKSLKSIFLVALLTAFIARSLPGQSPVMHKGNAYQTGEYPGKGVSAIEGIKFSFRTGGPIRSTAAFSKGKVLFGSSDGILYSLDESSGKLEWSFQTNGEIHSSPAVANGVVYVVSRDGFIYAVNEKDGKLKSKFDFGGDIAYTNGWDYYLSSPVIDDNKIYVGSGNGNVYALSPVLKVIWKFDTGARVRTSPVVSADKVFACSFNGYAFALDKATGKEVWRFAADGVQLNFEDAGYDRTSILGSPSLQGNTFIFGARDGFFYGVDAISGKQRWKVDHEGSWVLATAIDDSGAYSASGSSRFIQKVSLEDGKEIWRHVCESAIFAPMTWSGNVIYFSDYAGNVHGVDKSNGKILWKFALGSRIYSGPAENNNTIYVGTDEGYFYAIAGATSSTAPSRKKKLVYFEPDRAYTWFRKGLDVLIRDYFVSAGYEQINSRQLVSILANEKKKDIPGVIVFATTIAPSELMDPDPEMNLARRYLNNGGKLAFLGANPFAFSSDIKTGNVDSINFQWVPRKVFDLQYKDPGNINMDACYVSHPTADGIKLGLKGYWTGYGSITPDASTTVLAVDQYKQASCWIRNYGGAKGTGIIQMMLAKEVPAIDLSEVRAAVEWGIEW